MAKPFAPDREVTTTLSMGVVLAAANSLAPALPLTLCEIDPNGVLPL